MQGDSFGLYVFQEGDVFSLPGRKDPQHLAYNARALALIDREAKLWGVDAPTQVQISANDEQIEAYVKNMSVLAAASLEADEAEILDADVVEGEF